ncbi:MAG: hypothetical protein IPP77_12060 [Bacteroidetes bacterium]|nr:hypothetical protein [Bacteroidota bacterium]
MRPAIWIGGLVLLLAVSGCKKEQRVIYEVQEQQLYQNAAEKKTQKTTLQFVSILYNHLFGTSITNEELGKMDVIYQAFGDKKILEDMIVKSLLNRSGVQLPTNGEMRTDVGAFIQSAYLRFYNRKPTEFEAWKMKDLIEKNTDITPKMIFYSLMTSEEYRYY